MQLQCTVFMVVGGGECGMATLTVQLITRLQELALELATPSFRHGAQKSIQMERLIPLSRQR
jgi:hypothetical protein